MKRSSKRCVHVSERHRQGRVGCHSSHCLDLSPLIWVSPSGQTMRRVAPVTSMPQRAIRGTFTPALPFCHVSLRGQKPKPKGYPKVLLTVGDHIRSRRMDLGLLQWEVAKRIGCSTDTLLLWEKGRNEPEIRFWPGIIDFFGHDPSPAPRTVSERLMAVRRATGWSQNRLADELGVDASSVAAWEVGRRRPSRKSMRTLESVLERLGL